MINSRDLREKLRNLGKSEESELANILKERECSPFKEQGMCQWLQQQGWMVVLAHILYLGSLNIPALLTDKNLLLNEEL